MGGKNRYGSKRPSFYGHQKPNKWPKFEGFRQVMAHHATSYGS